MDIVERFRRCGHEKTPANLSGKSCRTCKRERDRRNWHQNPTRKADGLAKKKAKRAQNRKATIQSLQADNAALREGLGMLLFRLDEFLTVGSDAYGNKLIWDNLRAEFEAARALIGEQP